jgi:hypothetical protein
MLIIRINRQKQKLILVFAGLLLCDFINKMKSVTPVTHPVSIEIENLILTFSDTKNPEDLKNLLKYGCEHFEEELLEALHQFLSGVKIFIYENWPCFKIESTKLRSLAAKFWIIPSNVCYRIIYRINSQ